MTYKAFKKSNLTDIGGMFYKCSGLKSIEFNIDTSKVTTTVRSLYEDSHFPEYHGLFAGCTSLVHADLSGCDFRKTNLNGAFHKCTSLKSANLSGVALPKSSADEHSGANMFSKCTSLEKVIVNPCMTSMIMLPEEDVNWRTNWYSLAEGKWFTSKEIYEKRQGIADTYTKPGPTGTYKLSNMTVAFKKLKFTYSGQKFEPEPIITYGSRVLVKDKDYKVTYKNNLNAGKKAKVTVTGLRWVVGKVTRSFIIKKRANNLAVKAVNRHEVKTKGKKKRVKKAITIRNNDGGALTYKRIAKGSSPKLKINKKTGAVTVAKGTKKGTYKMKVLVSAKATTNYKAAKRNVTVKIKVV